MKVAVGLSGGVDSSVAALLLKRAGHDVIAVFMQNWHDTTGTLHGDCSWEEEKVVAEMVAKKLDIPFHFVDLSDIYRERVVDYMFREYSAGRTPNPDVMCNREIKFDAFMNVAFDLGADYVATGHYCRREVIKHEDGAEILRLLAGKDTNKDQSYFLCQLSQSQLSRVIFPIGGMLKPEVRNIAALTGLPSANKKDSQGICFVGKVDLPLFLQQKLAAKEGDVVEISSDFYAGKFYAEMLEPGYGLLDRFSLDELSLEYKYNSSDGKIIGKHQGAHFYTIGQRKGLNIGGHVEPLFIIGTDVRMNLIFVGEGSMHPGLFRKGLFISEENIHWIRDDLKMSEGEIRDYQVRIRYRQPLQNAKLFKTKKGLYIIFDLPQKGMTPGQFAVWYDGEEMLGSGVI